MHASPRAVFPHLPADRPATRRMREQRTLDYFEAQFPEMYILRREHDGVNRRADLVRSDADMDRIIEGIARQQLRAQRHMQTLAAIPPMILDEQQRRGLRWNDRNGLVEDCVADERQWRESVWWSDAEHRVFCEKLLLYWKRFDKIASFLPGKTTADCVLHYYRTKKKEKFKKLYRQAVARRRRQALQERPLSDRPAESSLERMPIGKGGDARSQQPRRQPQQPPRHFRPQLEPAEHRAPSMEQPAATLPCQSADSAQLPSAMGELREGEEPRLEPARLDHKMAEQPLPWHPSSQTVSDPDAACTVGPNEPGGYGENDSSRTLERSLAAISETMDSQDAAGDSCARAEPRVGPLDPAIVATGTMHAAVTAMSGAATTADTVQDRAAENHGVQADTSGRFDVASSLGPDRGAIDLGMEDVRADRTVDAGHHFARKQNFAASEAFTSTTSPSSSSSSSRSNEDIVVENDRASDVPNSRGPSPGLDCSANGSSDEEAAEGEEDDDYDEKGDEAGSSSSYDEDDYVIVSTPSSEE